MARHAGALVLCLFLLTMAGHTSSPDEESLFYMTRSLVERGQLDIPEEGRETITLLAPGRDGRVYAPYGPVPSLLMTPLYLAGNLAAKAFEPRLRDYVLRLATGILSPILMALCVAILVQLSIDLGASQAVAVALGLACALGTIVWPYSRWQWSEPASALALLLALFWTSRALRRPGLGAPLLAGVALAAAAGTKLPALATLPGFLLVLALPRRGSDGAAGWPASLARPLAFAAAPAAGALLLLALNGARFGRPLETGYQALGAGRSAFEWGSREGILGLVASPGKSFLLYSPPLLLGIVGLAPFWRRAPHEAFLVLWLAATHLFVYGSFRNWHGDASWGPRYLVPVTAPLLLPALALLDRPPGRGRRAARATLALLGILGVAVQLPGVLLDYAAYTVRTDAPGGPGQVARRFQARHSPIPGHVRLLVSRWRSWRAYAAADLLLTRGFSWPEGDPASVFPRWSSAEVEIEVRTGGRAPLRLELDYLGFRPRSLEPARIAASAGEQARIRAGTSFDDASQRGTLSLWAPAGTPDPLLLTLRINPWSPARDAGLPDERELGVLVEGIRAEVDGRRLSVGAALVPRLPVSERRPWGKEAMAWFYEPPQLLDVWTCHVWFSGLPRALVLLAAIPLLGLAVHLRWLYRALRGGGAGEGA